jgi:hypothetical protein
LCSEANGAAVVGHGLDYLFGLKEPQPVLLREAKRLLRWRDDAEAETSDVVGKTLVTRRLFTTTELSGLQWDHLQTVVRVQSEKHDVETGQVLEQEERYFVSSLPASPDHAGLRARRWRQT